MAISPTAVESARLSGFVPRDPDTVGSIYPVAVIAHCFSHGRSFRDGRGAHSLNIASSVDDIMKAVPAALW